MFVWTLGPHKGPTLLHAPQIPLKQQSPKAVLTFTPQPVSRPRGTEVPAPGEADHPWREEGPGAFDNRLLVSSSAPCAPRLSFSSCRQISPLSLGSLPTRGHPRAGAASVPGMGWPQPGPGAPTPVRRMDPAFGVQSVVSPGPHRVRGRKDVLESSLTPNTAPLAGSGHELMALSQKWRVGETDRQRDSGAPAAAPGVMGVTRG